MLSGQTMILLRDLLQGVMEQAPQTLSVFMGVKGK